MNEPLSLPKHIKIHFLTLQFIISLLLSPCLANDFISKQNESNELLAKYIKSSDWKHRQEIQSFKGDSEILASRILKAFNILSAPGIPCDDYEIKDDAWNEIYRNPEYSILVLEPIIREKLSQSEFEEQSRSSFPFVTKDNINLFFQICVYVSVISNDKFGLPRLKELANDSDATIANLAQEYIHYYENDKKSPQRLVNLKNSVPEYSNCYQKWLW